MMETRSALTAPLKRGRRAAPPRQLGRNVRCGGVDHRAHTRDAIRREAADSRVLANHLFVIGDVDAVDLVVGDVAFHPLDLRPESAEHAAGLLGDGTEFLDAHPSRSRHVALDDKSWHRDSLSFPVNLYLAKK